MSNIAEDLLNAYSDGFGDGYKQGQKDSQPKWILCSEELPLGNTKVVVSCLDNSGDTPFDYTSCGWMTTGGEYWVVDDEINNYVIAWMPLPECLKR